MFVIVFESSVVFSYQVEPKGTKSAEVVISHEQLLQRLADKASPFVASFMSDPVHERIVHQIYGCEGDEDTCSNPSRPHDFGPESVIAGAEWNDNPPFLLKKSSLKECASAISDQAVIHLPKQSLCWAKLLKDAERKAASGIIFDYASGAALVLRVHFGDLQFLHSMAPDNEDPNITRKRMLMWSELTWRVATGDFVLGTFLAKTNIDGMKELFSSGWSVLQLFTLGDPTYRSEIKNLAFGSLLHMISDSFALSHTERIETTGVFCEGAPSYQEPGRIVNFHSYGGQDHTKHGEMDTQDSLDVHLAIVSPSAVDVGKNLLSLYRSGKKWEEVKPYMECVFALDSSASAASPGDRFKP